MTTSAPSVRRAFALAAVLALAAACAGPRAAGTPAAGDAWDELGAADAAHAALDTQAEARALLALVAHEPRHPLAQIAVRRLDDLADLSPQLAREVDQGLAAALAKGQLQGLAAFRARAARAGVAEAQGELARGAALRGENGAITGWTILGPFGAYHALELDTRFSPETGPLPSRAAGAPGFGELTARALPAPDGSLALEGEPPGADIWYLAADVTVSEGGDHLAVLGSTSSFRAWLDGAPLAERRAHEGFRPLALVAPVRLSAGKHRLLVKLARGPGHGGLAVSLARADGKAASLSAAPATPDTPAQAARPGPFPAPVDVGGSLAAALEREAGPVRARILAARDVVEPDREGAKRLLLEARALLAGAPARAAPPRSADPALESELEAAAAVAAEDDPTLPDRTARARAEASLERAADLAPGDAASRLERARLALEAERLDEAADRLAALPPTAAERPLALLWRARADLVRGSSASAERLAERAHRETGLCGATDLLYETAGKRDAAALQDELVQALVRCPQGARRLAEHRTRRGDLAGAVALREAQVKAAPTRLEAREALARALVAAGDPARAAREWEELGRLWPRDPRIEKRRAEALEAAGDAKGAREARERALSLDGSDVALRRALAAEDGKEPLDDLAEDGDAALAAYRAARPKEETSSVYVLDAAAAEVNADGSLTERVHQIVKVRDARAADRYGEVNLPAGAQVLRLRTVKRDGRVLEPASLASDKGAVSLPGLEPGDFVEWEWIRGTPSRGAALPGFTADGFAFQGDAPLWRSRFVLRAPAGTPLRVESRAMPAPAPRREGAFDVVRASVDAAPPIPPEPSQADEQEFAPSVRVGAGAGLDELARALGDGFVDRTRASVEVESFARSIRDAVPEAERGGEALVRAAYARVAESILGGGSLGDGAGLVLARGRGNRLVLLAAVYRALGVDVRLALVRERGRDPAPSSFPRTDLYPRPVLRVRHGGGEWWLDPSQRLAPFGLLPPAARGQEALVVAVPGGDAERVKTPAGDPVDAREIALKVTVAPDGGAVVEAVETYRGWDAAAAKSGLEKADEQQRRQGVEQVLTRSFRGLALEELALEGENEPGPLVVRWRGRLAGWVRVEDGRAIADAPLFPARLGSTYAPRARRETPLLLASGDDARLSLTVVAPPSWRAVPQHREVKGDRGLFERTDRATEGGLVREERIALWPGRVAPAEYPAFARFANEVDAAQAAPLVFEIGAAPTATR